MRVFFFSLCRGRWVFIVPSSNWSMKTHLRDRRGTSSDNTPVRGPSVLLRGTTEKPTILYPVCFLVYFPNTHRHSQTSNLTYLWFWWGVLIGASHLSDTTQTYPLYLLQVAPCMQSRGSLLPDRKELLRGNHGDLAHSQPALSLCVVSKQKHHLFTSPHFQP